MSQLTTSTPHNGGLVLTQQGGHIRTLGLVPMVGKKQPASDKRGFKSMGVGRGLAYFGRADGIFFRRIKLENPFRHGIFLGLEIVI